MKMHVELIKGKDENVVKRENVAIVYDKNNKTRTAYLDKCFGSLLVYKRGRHSGMFWNSGPEIRCRCPPIIGSEGTPDNLLIKAS